MARLYTISRTNSRTQPVTRVKSYSPSARANNPKGGINIISQIYSCQPYSKNSNSVLQSWRIYLLLAYQTQQKLDCSYLSNERLIRRLEPPSLSFF